LVSCVIGLEKKNWPLMTSMAIGVFFFTRIILCHHTSSLSLKHTNPPESSDYSISIIMDLPYLIVIGNKKQGARSKGIRDHFEPMMRSSLISWSLLRLNIFVSRVFGRWHVSGSGSSCMW
jgi:hypothetical protein